MPNIQSIEWPTSLQLLEIAILFVVFYYLLLFLRGTRGAQVLTGLVFCLILLAVLTRFLRLDTLNWILQHFSVYLAVAFIVIFQPEIRRVLGELGKQHVFSGSTDKHSLIDPVVDAVQGLSERKIGALIALERETRMSVIQQSGTRLDAEMSSALLSSIFFPLTPLHDGGVIIRDDRIVCAGCVFPLSQREELSKALGTRHRAAIGLTEEHDAVVVVVSEETGVISLAYRGRLSRGLDIARLRRMLSTILSRGKPAGKKKKSWLSLFSSQTEKEA